MDEKISLEAISQYSEAYSTKILKGFFSRKDKITGQEILSLSDIQQVNLFVVRALFKRWKSEMQNLKSPYFNYEEPEVKEAFETLMQLLSNNIQVDQDHFTPLLEQAVSETLLAIFDPYDFFSLTISGANNRLYVATFQEEIRYVKVNKAPLERLLQKLREKNVDDISGNEAFAILDQILEEVNFNPDDVESYIEKFSAVEPLDPNRFYIQNSPEQSQPVAPPVENTPRAVEAEVRDNSLVENQKQSRPTVADNFQKISRIKDSLTINQKFMFTKVLFHGDFELFSKAIEHLDRQDNLKGALRYLEQDHASTWDRESEEFHEFMELLEKRFA